MTERWHADIVVLGGGMGGTVTALAAARRGATVAWMDKAKHLGGSALLSGGLVWCVRTEEALRERAPAGDVDLQSALIAGFPRLLEWLRGTGADVSPELDVMFGYGSRIDFLGLQQRAVAAVRTSGVVALDTEASCLLIEEGAVTGVRVRDSGGLTDVSAGAVVLATGGFQGNRHLLSKFLGDRAPRLLHRSNSASTGDGMRLALEAGAALAGDLSSYYGHLVPVPLPRYTSEDYLRFSVMFSPSGMLVNRSGHRFAREWEGYYRNAQRVAEQPEGRAALVFDERVRRQAASGPLVGGGEIHDTFDAARAVGARVASHASLAGLAESLADWGFAPADLAELVEDHAREAEQHGDGSRIAESPFHALEVRPAITFTQGGIRIDTSARVLTGDGAPIPGLYAVGADAGNVYNGGYAGGLSFAGTFALQAVDHALGDK